MSVQDAVKADLVAWDIADSTDGQRALVLAAALDDRAGVVNLAATDKQLGALMDVLREKHQPKVRGKLALLRGDADQTG